MKRLLLPLVAIIALITPARTQAQSPIYTDVASGHIYQAIRPGDNLTRIARAHIPDMIYQLREANPQVVGDRIYAGRLIQLPDVWYASGANVPAATTPVTAPTPTKEVKNMNYLLTQILLWTVLISAALCILYLIGRGLGVFHANQPAPVIITIPVPTLDHEPTIYYVDFYNVVVTPAPVAPPTTPPAPTAPPRSVDPANSEANAR